VIPVAEPSLGKKELEYVVDAVRSGWISSKGRYINEFEQKFAKYCGVKYAVSTSNGTVALHLALLSMGIGKNDEVIVPTLTFIATANAVAYTGAKPVFVDSLPGYWCIDPEKIEKAITPRTRAIIPVHLYGHPANMDPIIKIARKRDLQVIEDAAEAHGAQYKGKKVGAMGDLGVFSFYGNKIITTGEGGMIVTNNKKLASRAGMLKNQGMDPRRKYWHSVIGYNYRMTNIQAALGVAQLSKIDSLLEKRRKIAKLYDKFLSRIDGITPLSEQIWAKNVYWMYSVLIDKNKFKPGRDGLAAKLRVKGIETRPFFHSIHTLPPYKTGSCFPVAQILSREGINLPSSPNLSFKDVAHICNQIERIGRNAR
jgi:perosamine synthetase